MCSIFYSSHSWGWFFSSDYDDDDDLESKRIYQYQYEHPYGTEFDIEVLDNIKGKKLVENAMNKLAEKDKVSLSISCW